MDTNVSQPKIAVLGLGYVGLPLACMFANRYSVIGLDVNPKRVEDINSGHDSNDDLFTATLRRAIEHGFKATTSLDDIAGCNVYIVTVPTPVDANNVPDLEPLRDASRKISRVIKPGDTVIYESTVYPGTTEEECLPIIERESGLKLNKDFFAGYSPERVNPGDPLRPVEKICKITSGSNPATAEFVDSLYRSVLQVPTHRASSIKVAEAAKVLENTQRDVNIALMNEAAMVFNALGIDTNDVIEAASTKWNFQSLHPGLVGGHCISVDPYYLIHKAMAHGVTPALMSGARSINDSMHLYVTERSAKLLEKRGLSLKGGRVLLLGFTFKENCRDTRNTKVIDIYRSLTSAGAAVDIYDPHVDVEKAARAYGVKIASSESELEGKKYDLVIHCVSHDAFAAFDIKSHMNDSGAVYDLKGSLPRLAVDERL